MERRRNPMTGRTLDDDAAPGASMALRGGTDHMPW